MKQRKERYITIYTFKVFLDTNVLLKGFAASRGKKTLPAYITDSSTRRYTFEKCVFEAYMAFRGIGGKKPDEGRGDWAQRHLRAETDPSPINTLTNQVHGGNNERAFFWVNQILEAGSGIDSFEQLIENIVRPDGRAEVYEEVARLRQLALERGKFEHLCDKFRSFLREHSVSILPYCAVFDLHRVSDLTEGSVSVSPGMLDGFVRDTALPAEDFEIVYAALRLPADIFVTDDERLIRCATSLGLNFRLSPTSFCKGGDYSAKLQAMNERVHEVMSQKRSNESAQP